MVGFFWHFIFLQPSNLHCITGWLLCSPDNSDWQVHNDNLLCSLNQSPFLDGIIIFNKDNSGAMLQPKMKRIIPKSSACQRILMKRNYFLIIEFVCLDFLTVFNCSLESLCALPRLKIHCSDWGEKSDESRQTGGIWGKKREPIPIYVCYCSILYRRRWEDSSGCGSWPTIEYCLIIDLQRTRNLSRQTHSIPHWSLSIYLLWGINKIAGMNYDKGSWTAKKERIKTVIKSIKWANCRFRPCGIETGIGIGIGMERQTGEKVKRREERVYSAIEMKSNLLFKGAPAPPPGPLSQSIECYLRLFGVKR